MRIVFVSNRLPIVVEKSETGWVTRPGSGGLVTALVPLLKRWGGTWIGWAGVAGPELAALSGLLKDFSRREGYQIAAVPLSPKDYEQFYQGFCNEIIWPLFHDLQTHCNFVPEYWTSAQKVEQIFADVVARNVQPEDFLWIHDYHLMGLARVLSQRGLHNKMAFFLHIPFPPPDIFLKLPWRVDVLQGLLHYQVIGFQTRRDLENFSDCIRKLLPDLPRRQTPRQLRVEFEGRTCVAAVFPIGIDYHEFADVASSPVVERRMPELRRNFAGQQVILGLDRLDYTKGVPYRLKAFGLALERYPELHRAVTLLQVVVPSRETVPEYQGLKAEIERLVAQINGKFTQPGWVPIHHVFHGVDRQELIAWYRLADMALVTPLKDGMNLVAKEYCACQIDGNGVLVLSEFAGAAEQLGRWAVMVNPYDIDCVAAAIQLAFVMTPAERRPAMEKLRANIEMQDAHWWLTQFLRACGVRLGVPTPELATASTG
jgi:trehalose 6-phosphate synthase/phosphatase